MQKLDFCVASHSLNIDFLVKRVQTYLQDGQKTITQKKVTMLKTNHSHCEFILLLLYIFCWQLMNDERENKSVICVKGGGFFFVILIYFEN